MAKTTVPGKCHFGADGWLRGPIAITHVLTPNRYSSGFADRGQGLVMHTEAGFEAGTVDTFMNPASRVSAFFSIGRSGAATQYAPVGKGMVCWSQGDGNSTWRGVEDEDRTHPSIPLTAEQVATFAQILEACSEFDGFPLQVTDDTSGQGLIWHGAGGASWGNHPDCPGGVRKAQRPAIVELAKAIREGNVPSGPVAVTTDGTLSLAALCHSHGHGATPAMVLRLTAQHAPAYAPDVAAWINSVYDGARDAQATVPAGLTLYLPQ